jgi:molybdenum cofactor biosynthesis enzyme MoaA
VTIFKRSAIPVFLDTKPRTTRYQAKDLKGQLCTIPWNSINIGLNGDVFLCQCEAWMPSTVGNIWDDDLPTILSNAYSQRIRQSIVDGDYQYCNESVCNILITDQLTTVDSVYPEYLRELMQDGRQWRMPTNIMLALDSTCNLSCPSCRTQVVKKDDEDEERIRYVSDTLRKNLFSTPTKEQINLTVSTSGELFASSVLMNMVNEIDLNIIPNLKLQIQTNGLLIPDRWHRIAAKHHCISTITVTVDAASGDTYELIRRGGRWPDMIRALEFVAEQRALLGFELKLRMVIQQRNYREAAAFYQLAQQYGADLVEYTRLTDWHTWSPDEFRKHDVLDPEHPEEFRARQILARCVNQPRTWHNFLL